MKTDADRHPSSFGHRVPWTLLLLCALAMSLSAHAADSGDKALETDNLRNVLPRTLWRPVPYKINPPTQGVRLDDGLFKTAMDNSTARVLNGFSDDQMLRPFRERANLIIDVIRPGGTNWDNSQPGSSAARFLISAGTTLHWTDDPELRRRMSELVDGIAASRETNGYLLPYVPQAMLSQERADGTRTWLTLGLIEAGSAGNTNALRLLRDFYNWFDTNSTNPYLPELLRRGGQGMLANTRVYLTRAGKPEDIYAAQRYFQENELIDQLSNRDPKAIAQYPYEHAPFYLLNSIQAYLDLYRVTGARRYVEAGLGGWDLYRLNWQYVGGSLASGKNNGFPPTSYFLHANTADLCENVSWIYLSQSLACLYPDQEKYISEIERSIYNVALANQDGQTAVRCSTKLMGHKDRSTNVNTCCEIQAARLFGSLPGFIYSLGRNDLYINLFARSTIEWQDHNTSMRAKMTTDFPFKPDVQIQITPQRPIRSKIHVRVPDWAAMPMLITVNGKPMGTGNPGTYVVLDRKWRNHDTIAFTLPMNFKLMTYNGTPGRYALQYGPILMAVTGPMNEQSGPQLPGTPKDFVSRLKPKEGHPLHFTIEGAPQHELIPYWEVKDEPFSCFPLIGIP